MLLNFLIGVALIAGALAIPLLLLAFCAGRCASSSKWSGSVLPDVHSAPCSLRKAEMPILEKAS